MACPGADDDRPDDDALDIAVRHEAGAAVVEVAGELDAGNADQFRRGVATALATAPARLVVDLAGVEFMDSSAVAVLLEANAGTVPLVIRRPSEMSQHVIRATGLTTVFEVEP